MVIGLNQSIKSKYLSSAFLLLLSSIIVKVIGAVYKIPLTAFIGAVGRGYFAAAYNICLPIHAVTMGTFPIALSRLISKYNALNDKNMILSLKKGSQRLFLLVGAVGTAIMFVIAQPYSVYIAHSPKSIYTILVLAPSILFSCIEASYRGYYEGFMNMVPTSVSQTMEAFVKMIFGLIFAKLSMSYLYSVYVNTGELFSQKVSSDAQALSIIYPITSAAAMLGVTFGSFVSMIYLAVYYRINRSIVVKSSQLNIKKAQRELLSFSFPIMISCAVQSFFQFLDTATVQYSLGNMDIAVLKNAYSQCINMTNVPDKDLVTYVYGLLSAALDFKNLIPGVTMALGICAVPAISSACEINDKERLDSLINSIYKYTALLSAFGGVLIALNSTDILNVFYGSSSQDIVVGCDNLVKYFSLTVPFYSMAGTAVFCVQAVGHPKKSIAAYAVCGIIRVVLNILLVSDERFVLLGSVISGAAGYLIMCIWNIIIVKKVSVTKFDIISNIIKPIMISAITYFSMYYLFGNAVLSSNNLLSLCLKALICAAIFVALCLLFKSFTFSEIFSFTNCKKNGLNA